MGLGNNANICKLYQIKDAAIRHYTLLHCFESFSASKQARKQASKQASLYYCIIKTCFYPTGNFPVPYFSNPTILKAQDYCALKNNIKTPNRHRLQQWNTAAV